MNFTNNWGHKTNQKLNRQEKIMLQVRYCKECGKRLPFPSGHRKYCEKCRPIYPSDITRR